MSSQNIFVSQLLLQKQQKVGINSHKWLSAFTYLLSRETGDGFKMLDFWKPNANTAKKVNNYIYILQRCHENEIDQEDFSTVKLSWKNSHLIEREGGSSEFTVIWNLLVNIKKIIKKNQFPQSNSK